MNKFEKSLSLCNDIEARLSELKELIMETEQSQDKDDSDHIVKVLQTFSQQSHSLDPLFKDAARLLFINQIGSTSLIQRKFAIGYNRAARLMEQLEEAGIVSIAEGSKSREVLVQSEAALNRILESLR